MKKEVGNLVSLAAVPPCLLMYGWSQNSNLVCSPKEPLIKMSRCNREYVNGGIVISRGGGWRWLILFEQAVDSTASQTNQEHY